MASTAFRSVTPLVPRINGADYVAFPLDGNADGADDGECIYMVTVIAEGTSGSVTSNPALVDLTVGETEVYQVTCDDEYEFIASSTATFYKDNVPVGTGLSANIPIDADAEIKVIFEGEST